MESESVKGAVKGFVLLINIGWDVETALTYMYSEVCYEIDSNKFISLCKKEFIKDTIKGIAKSN